MKLGAVTITPAALLAMAAAWWLDSENVFPLFLIAASVHELAHLFAAKLCSPGYLSGATLTVDFLCAEISTGYMEPKHEAVCVLAGPAANLLLFFAIMLLPCPGENLLVMGGISLILGIFNLLPMVFLDGGRLLRLLLDAVCVDSENISFAVSLAVSAGLCALGLAFCFLFGCGYGLFALSVTLLVKHFGCKTASNTLK